MQAEALIREKLATPDGFIRLALLVGYPHREIVNALVSEHGLSRDGARAAVVRVEGEVT